jgi:hypothetical protein
MSSPTRQGVRRRQRGFVVGRRTAGALFFAVEPALARDCEDEAFFFAAGFLPAGTGAPEATREECFVRCLVFFAAAASAVDDSVNAATSATTNIFNVLRTMRLTIARLR